MTDIAATAEAAHAAGAHVVVDSTVCTPVLCRPIEHGADLVMHSATKQLNGHADVLAGALITAQQDDLWERITHDRGYRGAVLGPFEAWLLLRGMRTLFLRVPHSARSAQRIAEWLTTAARGVRGVLPWPAVASGARGRGAADVGWIRDAPVRSVWRVARTPRSGWPVGFGCSRTPRRSAASRVWSSTGRRWKAQAHACPMTCCGSRSGSRRSKTSWSTSNRRWRDTMVRGDADATGLVIRAAAEDDVPLVLALTHGARRV